MTPQEAQEKSQTPAFQDWLTGLVNALRPVARELVELAKTERGSKDGYAVIYRALTALNNKGKARALLMACIAEGYPPETALEIDKLL